VQAHVVARTQQRLFIDVARVEFALKRFGCPLRERAFGIPIGMRDRSDPTPFCLRIPERIAEATDVIIRDLEGSLPEKP